MGLLNSFKSHLWDLWCAVSIVGIWPRFVEPRLIDFKTLSIRIPNLPDELEGLKILQISDLHLNNQTPDSFLKKVALKGMACRPDLIVFTGDFLCYSQLNESVRLKSFLTAFEAPYGCYAILGNHDYSQTVSISPEGDYDVIVPLHSNVGEGFSRLFRTTTLTKKWTSSARSVNPHGELVRLLQDTPFKLLDNATKVLKIGGTGLNLTGLGEYMAGKMLPEQAFADYDSRYPGLVLLHNPDGAPYLANYPGDFILSGHTHGGQVNLPWMWKKFTLMENPQFKKGLHRLGNKKLYISKGLGSVLAFRWFAMPELTLFKLEK